MGEIQGRNNNGRGNRSDSEISVRGLAQIAKPGFELIIVLPEHGCGEGMEQVQDFQLPLEGGGPDGSEISAGLGGIERNRA